MTKQIKLIRLVTSLTLPLSLVLFSPSASLASDNTLSDKTQWLTSSLDDTERSKAKEPILQALSAREDNQSDGKSIIVRSADNPRYVVKLRPFLAHRKLPSRRDLELALQAEQARMAQTANPRLNGQVSAFTRVMDNSAPAYINSPSLTSIAKTKTNWQASTISRSTNNLSLSRSVRTSQASAPRSRRSAAFSLSEAEKYFQQTESSNLTATPPGSPRVNETVNPQQSFSFLQTAEHHLFSPQMVPAADSFNTETNTPTSLSMNAAPFSTSNGDVSGFGSAGPPPFPLNLLPARALKQLIRSVALGVAPRNTNSPRSYFGSWHNGMNLNPSPYPYISNLPPTGFHSFIQPSYSRRARFIHTSNHWALPVVTAYGYKSAAKNHGQRTVKDKSLVESQVRIATYPPYVKQPLKSLNFMQ